MASALHWIPDSLYNYSITVCVTHFNSFQKQLRRFPAPVLFDIYYKLYKEGRLCRLGHEFSKLDIFLRLLQVHDKRYLLHNCFQATIDHDSSLARSIANSYKLQCYVVDKESASAAKSVQLGLMLGSFFSDAGWFVESDIVISAALELSKRLQREDSTFWNLRCYIWLLHARTSYFMIPTAETAYDDASNFIRSLKDVPRKLNLAALYSEFSTFFYCLGKHNEAYSWSMKALESLSSDTLPSDVVTVLRQASKTCVIKVKFKKAELLIKQALLLAREHFGDRHPTTASTLMDYGFYLLSAQYLCHSVEVYHTALEARQCIFGGQNLLVAMAHEDLAFALYRKEYTSGKFKDAQEHADKALEIMHNIVPDDHMLIASSKRVKALILEERAIDSHDELKQKQMFLEAYELHQHALRLAVDMFGLMSIRTAHYYGNLARLYQSMKRLEDAVTLFQKVIFIKESILGQNDLEVAVTLGHLASVYSHDLMDFEKAEELYLRALNIESKVSFNAAYNYAGLSRVYQNLNRESESNRYLALLHEWKLKSEERMEEELKTSALNITSEPIPQELIYTKFKFLD